MTFDGATITVNGDFATGVGSDVVAAAITAVNGGADLTASSDGTADVVAADVAATYNNITSGGSDAGTQSITVVGTAASTSNVSIQVVEATGIGTTPTVTGDATNGYVVRVDDSGSTTLSAIATAIQGIAQVATATASTPAAIYNGTSDTSLNAAAGVTTTLTGGTDAGSDIIQILGNTTGNNNRALAFVDSANLGDGVLSVTDDGTTITINLDDTSTFTLAQIKDAINSAIGTNFTASITQTNGNGSYNAATDTAPSGGSLVGPTGGVAASGGISGAVVLELSGANGAEVLSFGAGTSIADLVKGINLYTDATGVEAAVDGSVSTTLNLSSSIYGSDGVVDIKVRSEGAATDPSGVFTSAVGSGARDTGTDIAATVNGVVATGKGNQITINTATLGPEHHAHRGVHGNFEFHDHRWRCLVPTRSGRGVEPTSSLGYREASIRLASVASAASCSSLAPAETRRWEVAISTTAATIVEEAINQVTSLRGRLGAFQRTTLGNQQASLERHAGQPDRCRKLDPRRRLRCGNGQPDSGSDPGAVRHDGSPDRQLEPAKRVGPTARLNLVEGCIVAVNIRAGLVLRGRAGFFIGTRSLF